MATANRIEGIAGGSRGAGGITGAGGKNVNPVSVAKALARTVGGIVGKGGKNVNPIYKEVVSPPPPPGVKPIDLKNPPKVPMNPEPKEPHVSERHDTAPWNKNPELPKKNKPMVLPGRGPFTGSMAPYNWTGK